MTDRKKLWRILTVIAGTALVLLFVFCVLPWALVLLLPFVIGYLLAKIIEPPVRFLQTRLKLPRKIGAGVCVALAVGILGVLIGMLISRIWTEINAIISQSDVIAANITARFATFRDMFTSRFGFTEAIEDFLADAGEKIGTWLMSYTMPAVRGAVDVVRAVPSAIIFLIVLIIGAYFMSSDRELLKEKTRAVLPKKLMQYVDSCVRDMFSALIAYLKAQLILICITFCELTIGFLIIGGSIADYALLLALAISIIDAIPILGTGTVLIPWGVYSLIVGDTRIGILLLVLYLICLAVRQMTEPRLVGKQIGLHPLVILMVMYAGLRLFGIFGMILGPIFALILKNMYASGVFARIQGYINGEQQ